LQQDDRRENMKTSVVKTKQNIITILRDNDNILKNSGIKKVGLFGSFVRNEQTDDSDVDLLAEFEKEQKTFDNFMNAAFFLEDLLVIPVELVTEDSISPYLKPHIMKEVEYVNII
jgi:predicted nucleotidyltransferase